MSDFYEVGTTYSNPTTDWLFRVDCITTHPVDGARTALGWRFWDAYWEPYAYEEYDWDIYLNSRRILDGR